MQLDPFKRIQNATFSGVWTRSKNKAHANSYISQTSYDAFLCFAAFGCGYEINAFWRVYYFSAKKLKDNHHSMSESNRRTIASYDIILKSCEQQSGNVSNDNLNQDLNIRPVDYEPNTTSSELNRVRTFFYVR